MGNATAMLISALAEEVRQRAACSAFADPRDWGEPNGIALPRYIAWASPRESGYSVALDISRALLLRVLSSPAPDDVARLASRISVHEPTLARIGTESYARRGPRASTSRHCREPGLLMYLV